MFIPAKTRRPEALTAGPGDTTFEMYLRTESVVLITGEGSHWDVFESVHAGRIMRELRRCGRDGVRVRGIVCERGALSLRSIRALNCFLRHNPNFQAFRRVHRDGGVAIDHRFAWRDFQEFLGLQFTI
jgi:hypothetical protein